MYSKESNNFDFLRLLFSLFIIITHSYSLTGHLETDDYLGTLTSGLTTFSNIGLLGFFVISGFLINKSFLMTDSPKKFIIKRTLRIYPALIFMLIFSIFIIAPLFSGLTLLKYFYSKENILYLFDTLLLFKQKSNNCINNLFRNNPHGCEFNGSLWTISYEFIFYILFCLFYLVKKNSTSRFLILIIALSFLIYIKQTYIDSYFKYDIMILNTSIGFKSFTNFSIYFIIGIILSMFYYEFQISSIFNVFLIPLYFLFIFLLYYFKSHNIFLPIFISLLIVSCGLSNNIFKYYKNIGDLSYGIYLWAFPIQQYFVSKNILDPSYLSFISILFSILFAFSSWHLVEKKIQNYKFKYL